MPCPVSPSIGQALESANVLIDSARFKTLQEKVPHDFVVIGTGFAAYAFAEAALAESPDCRVLMLEAGGVLLPTHFQDLAPTFKVLAHAAESKDWALTATAKEQAWITEQRGHMLFLGGRSTMWSAWAPKPRPWQIADWPDQVEGAIEREAVGARELLNVKSASEINASDHHPGPGTARLYGELQDELERRIETAWSALGEEFAAEPASLAVDPGDIYGVDFAKFATPGPLMNLVEEQGGAQKGRLEIVLECRVLELQMGGGRVVALETSRGRLPLGNSEIILAAGTMANTQLAFSTGRGPPGAGDAFAAHMVSKIVARVPRDELLPGVSESLELAAIYCPGLDKKNGGQFHLQVTGIASPKPERDKGSALRHMPDIMAMADPQHLMGSSEHVVLIMAIVCEMEATHGSNYLRPHGVEAKIPPSMELQYVLTSRDKDVWDTAESIALGLMKDISDGAVEFWTKDSWQSGPPQREEMRIPGLVHEACTLRMGPDEDLPVDLEYRLRGTHNVYVTGAALWPSNGSWNPTLAICCLARDLAKQRVGARD